MDPIALSAIGAVVVSVITSIALPYLRNRKKNVESIDATKVVSWQSLTSAIQKERDDLRKELDGIEAEYRIKFRALEEDYNSQLTAARTRIQQLENEVAQLSIRLYRNQAPPSGS